MNVTKAIKPRQGAASEKEVSARSQIRLREARPNDAGFVTRLSGMVFGIYGPYEEMVSTWFRSGIARVLIAAEGSNLLGFAMIGPVHYGGEENVSELLAIAVVPEEQHRGIGTLLLEEIERLAIRLGEKKLFLHTAGGNLAAQRLFIRIGYHLLQVERAFYPAGQDALMMVKELGP